MIHPEFEIVGAHLTPALCKAVADAFADRFILMQRGLKAGITLKELSDLTRRN